MPWAGGHGPLEQGSPRGMEGVQGAPPRGTSSLPDMAWATGQSCQASLPPPALGKSREVAGSCRIPLPSPAPSQQAASRAKQRPSDGAAGLCLDGGCPRPGPGPRAVERCQPNQGLGRYLKAAMASMACCRTAVCRRSLGSSSSSTCRTKPGWDLAAASTQCQQTQHQAVGLAETLCPRPGTSPQRPPATPAAGVSAGRASQRHPSPLGACPRTLAPALPLPMCWPSWFAGARGPCPLPRPAGCPLTLIFSASSNLWQNAFRPCDKPLHLPALHRAQMVSRNCVLWASSWQPRDRETNVEREKVETWPAGLEHWGCSAGQTTWREQLCPASSPPAAPAAGSRAGGPVRRCRHSCHGNGHGYLF